MPDSSNAALSLRETNLEFLAGLDPALAGRLRATGETHTRPVLADGTVVDIDLGDSRLYGGDGQAFADEQVASFLRQPTRLVINRPDADKLLDPYSKAMVSRFEAWAAEASFAPDAAPPADRSGVLFVVGLGLGLHVARLIERTGPRHVVLVEPIGEFLHHALAAIDLPALHAACAQRGATLDIVAEPDVGGCLARIEAAMIRFGETVMDGSYIYVHYTIPATTAIAGRIHEFAGMQSILKGYFDDERLMVENMVANVAAHDFRMIDGTVQPPCDTPLFIVGSGPSLDASIEAIRRCRDGAVVVTAGSALQVLLHHGIVPDWHVEKENSDVSVARLHHILARNRKQFPDGRFAGIRLVASTTVDPGVTALFDDIHLFLRTALSSSAMFGAGHRAVDGTAPFSANAAMTVAALLGFRDIWLFGCDCGARAGAGHHAAQTVYYTRAASRDAGRVEFPHRAPANFGGEVETNSYFLWSRRTYEQVIAALGLRVRNCSDGIAIAGAEPVRPEALDLAGTDIDRDRVAAHLLARSTWYPAGHYLDRQDVAGVVAQWHGFAAALRARLDALDREAGDVHAYHRAVAQFVDGAQRRFGGAAVLAGGTVRAQAALASWWLNRAPDAAAEAALYGRFCAACRELVEDMLARGDALMAAVAARGTACRFAQSA